jgi:hypothetical protein
MTICSRNRVTIDGVWIGNRIYWIHYSTCDYTLQITITQKLVFSIMVFTALLGNLFEPWTFHFSQADGHLTPTSHSPDWRLTSPVQVALVSRVLFGIGPRRDLKSKSKLHCDWRSVSQSVSLGVEPHLGLMTRYLLLLDSYGLVSVGRALWREVGTCILLLVK